MVQYGCLPSSQGDKRRERQVTQERLGAGEAVGRKGRRDRRQERQERQ